jgi:CRISPR/Cas system CMR subunit Cmr4 (Cas7 group RAMP superfamily)
MIQAPQSPQTRIERNQRNILRRIIIRGCLVLNSPTCLGSGDSDSPTDMPLLRDSISQAALLTGASIAGSLRNYLREYEKGHTANESANDLSTTLFGAMRKDEDDEGDQSPLITFDSISSSAPSLELRDGVKINSTTGTAVDKAKYDLELLASGTIFPLQLELLVNKTNDENDENQLRKALGIALQGLEKGEISLGMKKQRGFGRCKVAEWQVWDFDLTDPQRCREWLEFDHWTPGFLDNYPKIDSIAKALGVDLSQVEDNRDRLTLEATFSLDGSLLIRSGQASTGKAPDVVHLKSKRNGDDVPVISGTSLAGVLRHRAERIINTLEKPNNIIDEMFGPDFSEDRSKKPKASRLIVHEAEIEKSHDMVQNRIAIDRFTGGAYHGALFDEQPVWGNDDTRLKIELELRDPKDYDIGLLLLLLKDLWTGDLPIGGESSIGRGRLQGKEATLTRYQPGKQKKEWVIKGDQHLEIDKPNELEAFVKALVDAVSEEEAA